MAYEAGYYGTQSIVNGYIVHSNGRVTIHYTDGVTTVITPQQIENIRREIRAWHPDDIVSWMAVRLGMVVRHAPLSRLGSIALRNL